MMRRSSQVPSNYMATQLWLNVLEIWIAAFFYGLYFVLFSRSIHILLIRLRQLERQGVFLGAMVILFVLSTAQAFVIGLKSAVVVGYSDMPIKPILTASVLIYVTSSICSDALLIYRCYVIWDSNIYVIGPSVILLISATVSGYMRSITIFQIISLTTGISVTLLTVARVVWSAYKLRAFVDGGLRGKYISASSAIIESGALYALFVSVHFGFSAHGSPVSPVLFAAVSQIVGIAPTLIIVRAGSGQTKTSQFSLTPKM